MSSLSIDSVSKRYGAQTVLDNIHLEVDHGKVLALLGPSGCGKTTLLRLIAGFETVDAGTIVVGGRELSRAKRHAPPEKRNIGYVPQEGGLFPHLSVLGNIDYGLPRDQRQGTRAAHLLALTGLQGLEQRMPYTLSGGQQQRVALARALAPSPALILLDEPFNALDLNLRRTICQEVAGLLRQENTTAVLVTHDPSEAFTAADEVAVMNKGGIVQCADPATVYLSPATRMAAQLTGPAIFLPGHVDGPGVRCVLGTLALHPKSWRGSGEAWVMLRPEQLVLAEPGQGAMARVLRRSFHGAHTTAAVAVQDYGFDVHLDPRRDDGAPEIALTVSGACMAYPRDGVAAA